MIEKCLHNYKVHKVQQLFHISTLKTLSHLLYCQSVSWQLQWAIYTQSISENTASCNVLFSHTDY